MLELLIMQQVQEQQLPHQEDFLIHLNLLVLLLKEIRDHQPQVQELVQALVLMMIRPEPIML
jgi:competence protein ComGF